MSERDIRDYLSDILDAVTEIKEITKDSENFNSFVQNKEKTYSAIYLLAKIGEAVKKIPDTIKSNYSQIPWRDISGMRDILLHEYFRVDLEKIWETIKKDLDPLKKATEEILKDAEGRK